MNRPVFIYQERANLEPDHRNIFFWCFQIDRWQFIKMKVRVLLCFVIMTILGCGFINSSMRGPIIGNSFLMTKVLCNGVDATVPMSRWANVVVIDFNSEWIDTHGSDGSCTINVRKP